MLTEKKFKWTYGATFDFGNGIETTVQLTIPDVPNISEQYESDHKMLLDFVTDNYWVKHSERFIKATHPLI